VPGVEHRLGVVEPSALDELGWGNVEFGGKEPGEVARADPRVSCEGRDAVVEGGLRRDEVNHRAQRGGAWRPDLERGGEL